MLVAHAQRPSWRHGVATRFVRNCTLTALADRLGTPIGRRSVFYLEASVIYRGTMAHGPLDGARKPPILLTVLRGVQFRTNRALRLFSLPICGMDFAECGNVASCLRFHSVPQMVVFVMPKPIVKGAFVA